MQDFDSNMYCKAGDSDFNTFPVGWTIHSQVTDLLVNGKTVPTKQDKAIWVQTHTQDQFQTLIHPLQVSWVNKLDTNPICISNNYAHKDFGSPQLPFCYFSNKELDCPCICHVITDKF